MKIKKKSAITLIIIISFALTAFAGTAFLQIHPISIEKARIFPVPKDHRNYFFFQSIGDESTIVIGDFTGSHRLISLIIDRDSDQKVDKIYDYYPDKKITISPRHSKSQFYDKNFERLTRKIISGAMFQDTYSYRMKSLRALKRKIEEGSKIRKQDDGYKAIIYDPDASSTAMSEFFFSKRIGRYNLVFRTKYYKIFNTSIEPPLEYSVYCLNSKNKVVKEIVVALLKQVR